MYTSCDENHIYMYNYQVVLHHKKLVAFPTKIKAIIQET